MAARVHRTIKIPGNLHEHRRYSVFGRSVHVWVSFNLLFLKWECCVVCICQFFFHFVEASRERYWWFMINLRETCFCIVWAQQFIRSLLPLAWLSSHSNLLMYHLWEVSHLSNYNLTSLFSVSSTQIAFKDVDWSAHKSPSWSRGTCSHLWNQHWRGLQRQTDRSWRQHELPGINICLNVTLKIAYCISLKDSFIFFFIEILNFKFFLYREKISIFVLSWLMSVS